MDSSFALDKPTLGVSSWSLNRVLGRPHFDALGGPDGKAPENGSLPLIELPARVREFGVARLELCHFHIPSAAPEYLSALRGALDEEGVELWSLLCDAGDITHPTEGEEWLKWNKGWIDIASQLGARHARVIAGKQKPTPENLQLAKERLQILANHANEQNVRVLTENWFDILGSSKEVLWLLGELDGAVGLNFDFGNWTTPAKYAELPRVAHLAESAHAKCSFPAPREPNTEDFEACLGFLRDADFKGSYTLIYDGPDSDEWGHLEIERDIVQKYI